MYFYQATNIRFSRVSLNKGIRLTQAVMSWRHAEDCAETQTHQASGDGVSVLYAFCISLPIL